MADNAPVPEGAPQPPALPTAPPLKQPTAGKVVVLLSSVAKAPPVKNQAIAHVAPTPSAPKEVPLRPSLKVVAPPPLPAKKIVDGKLVRPGGNAEVRALTKTTVISSTSTGKDKNTVPPLVTQSPVTPLTPVPEKSEPKKTSARLLIPKIVLNETPPEPAPEVTAPEESILLGPGETQEHPTRPPANVAETTPPPLPTTSPLVVLPPVGAGSPSANMLQPPVVLKEGVSPTPSPATKLPPPLPKSADKSAPPAIQAVPKLVGAEAHETSGKLRPPQLRTDDPLEKKKEDSAVAAKESTSPGTVPPALPSKAPTTASSGSKVTGPIIQREKTEPPVMNAKALPPPIEPTKATGKSLAKPEESRPALRPPVLPNKALANLKAGTEAAASTTGSADKLPPQLSVVPEMAPAAKAAETEKRNAPVGLPSKTDAKPPVVPTDKPPLPLTRAERSKKRRRIEAIAFYVILVVLIGPGLYLGTLRFCRETKLEGQVIPPAGMPLADEVWIVSDFRQLAAGITDDLAEERAPLLLEMHEKQDHVQRVQADLAMREERIRLLQAQIQAAKDEEGKVVMQAHDAAQELWDGPGAKLDDDYNARRIALQDAIASRAKSLNLKYAPDPAYNAPEVWANAYRLGLYEVPTGVDAGKEYQWLADQMKAWRDFVKAQDDKREQLREQAAQIKMSPAAKLTDLNAKIDELQHRIDNTQAEEEPLKPELQQAQADLAEVQTTETGLDAKYYRQLSALPVGSVTKRLPMDTNGRFSWPNLENDSPFAEGEKEHRYWIFARATRADGREYWALGRFSIQKDHTLGLLIEPDSFVSTKAMLRPELTPDEQAQ